MPLDIGNVDPNIMLGRWVRSPSKFDNWPAYMEWFGFDEELVRKETVEPQIHIIKAFSKTSMTILHLLPERDGLSVEYTVPIDGKEYDIPPIMVKSARSSWKANAQWVHSWHERGLLTFQVMKFPKGNKNLRYWRSLLSENEIKISVEVSDAVTDKVEIYTNRYFHKIPYLTEYNAASAQFFSGADVPANAGLCVHYIQKAKSLGAKIIVLPENSNRERDYFANGKPSKELCYERSEELDGAFVKVVRDAAKENGMWVVVGVDLRGKNDKEEKCVYISQLLIGPDGFLHGVHRKHVLWDYEYTLFEPSGDPYVVYDTELGRLGMLCCADGIVPEAARVLGAMGCQVLLNSLNSRGPDELRMHIPCRAMENGCWHVSSNTVGNPGNVGLLWPWTGGSQIVAPDGTRVATASEEKEEMIVGKIEVRPWPEHATASKVFAGLDVIACRRPRLYKTMTEPVMSVPASEMYGPAPSKEGELPVPKRLKTAGTGIKSTMKVSLMQFSKHHTDAFTLWAAKRQIVYAKKRGTNIGVFPSLFCFAKGEVCKNPSEAAERSQKILQELCAAAKESSMWLALSLVERDPASARFFHTAYLINASGVVHAQYRKTHLSVDDTWASRGDALSEIIATPWGVVALMLEEEVWVPEIARCLALQGAEVLLHPTSWRTDDDAHVCAVERCSENRVHLVSVNRLDSPAKVGSQVCFAGEFLDHEPIPLMRYPMAQLTRYGVEEHMVVELHRREAHCKMMGYHLDVLKKRWPDCYNVLVTECQRQSGSNEESEYSGYWFQKLP
eukprot:gnl/MRDRNA2_/MRDRNA2_160985_c0_seq1.p1 gnl/MRDRNA2_/MRDRNA2_160985_c0~~gnl/MRDRNA2_/MRDRNA2_160985_c0_seq1.p1  ORF type:complete len:786 (-),score=117.16 gnl/MRDRNA2_/MRDRNA2_160985_c0_seq1:6-2363(-)